MSSMIAVIGILPGKEGSWKEFAGACNGTRADEFGAFSARHGLTGHAMWLQVMPEGNSVAVYAYDGDGAEGFLDQLATATDAFDIWFADRLVEAHALDLRTGPLGPPATQWAAWRA